jgi:hypothetical protein
MLTEAKIEFTETDELDRFWYKRFTFDTKYRKKVNELFGHSVNVMAYHSKLNIVMYG